MTLDIIIAVVTSLVSLILASFIYAKNSRSATNVYFALLIVFIGLYPVFNYLALHSNTPETALFWAKFILVSAIPAGSLLYLFVSAFPGKKFLTNKLSVVFVIWVVINIFLGFLGLIFQRVEIINGQPAIQTGPAIASFAALQIISLVSGAIILYRKYRHATGRLKLQLRYINYGITLSFGATLVATLVIPLLFKNSALIPLSPLFLLIAEFSIAYSILKNHLLDIRSIVAKSVAYVLLLVSLAVLYGGAIFSISNLLFPGASIRQDQQIIYIVLALTLAFSFQPLRRFFENATARMFFQNRYNSQIVLNNFSKILVYELDLDRILKRSITDICQQLNIQFGQIVVFNHDRVYRIEHHGPLPMRLMVVPELQRLKHAVLVADELPEGERKELLDEHGIRVSLMLRTREEFIGYLLLGDKLSGDIYSSQDLEVLEIIAKQLAVAILNAKAYAEIQEFNQTLQARVDHATSRLRVANRHLKELDQAKDEFISMASHQLRTPLTTIKGYLSMMLEGDAGRMSKTQTEFAGYAFGSSERMVNLISDLLNVSRLSAGRFIIQTKPTDMVDMIRDEVRQLETHASAKNIKLIFDPPALPLPLAEIDDNKTRQVVMNFIDNAIYYTQTGSVTVTLDQTGQYVRLRVTDTGIGVPEEAKKKLFSKFFRADNAMTVRPDGTGLGLYLARRVVEDQGGTILFSSSLGKGSTFGFELPLRPASVNKKEG